MQDKDKELREEGKKNKQLYCIITVCICFILFCLFLGFAIYQNFIPKPIYVDPPINNGVQVVEKINKTSSGDLVYRGEPIEFNDLVYRGEKIEYTYLK